MTILGATAGLFVGIIAVHSLTVGSAPGYKALFLGGVYVYTMLVSAITDT